MKIFLVDDDKIYQFTAKKTLESMGLGNQVTIFSEGESALRFLKDHLNDPDALPDVIFLDINMPMMDGWEFVEAFQQLDIKRRIYIYMVSSSVDENDLQKSKQYPVISDYIIKPVGKSRFEQLIGLMPGNESTQD